MSPSNHFDPQISPPVAGCGSVTTPPGRSPWFAALPALLLAAGMVLSLPAQSQVQSQNTAEPASSAAPSAGAPAGKAQASEVPAGVSAALGTARLVGSSRFTYWGFEVYQASLWAGPDFQPSVWQEGSLALDLRYLRAFKGADIAQRSIDEMRRLPGFVPARAEVWIKLMQDAFPDVKPGDRLTGIQLPGKGLRILFNGQPRLEVADAEFARVFLGIWLSDKTAAPKLRQALLGLV